MKKISLEDIKKYDHIYSEDCMNHLIFDEKDRFMMPLHNSYVKLYRNNSLIAVFIMSYDGTIGMDVNETNTHIEEYGFKIVV